jgi:hypothetical protein
LVSLCRPVRYGARASRVDLVQLNGRVIKELPLQTDAQGRSVFEVALPSKGIGTLRILAAPPPRTN